MLPGTPATARTLVVMRHARAESFGPDDAARVLAREGHRDAAAAGRWLAEVGVVPDHALVSAAVRTRETYEDVALAAGWSLEPDVDRALYSADVESALDLVRRVPAHVRTLLVVGHNPTVASLAQLLDDGAGDPAATAALLRGEYPTAALTVLDVPVDWDALELGGARARAHHVARA